MNRDELRKRVDELKTESLTAHDEFIGLTNPGFLSVTESDEAKEKLIEEAKVRCEQLDRELSDAMLALLRSAP